MGIGLEFIFNTLGLDNPLIGAISVLMDKLSGLVVVHRVNLILCIFNVRTLYLKALNEHFSQQQTGEDLKKRTSKQEEEEKKDLCRDFLLFSQS
jgi:hypothetical protein